MSGGAAQSYRYLRPSALVADRDGADLCLETSGGRTASGQAANPRFFAGFLTEPEQAATGLLAVAEVARARYYVPMTAQRLQETSTRWSRAAATGCGSSRSPAAAASTPGSTCSARPRRRRDRTAAPPTSTSTAAARGAGPGRRRRPAAPVGRAGRRHRHHAGRRGGGEEGAAARRAGCAASPRCRSARPGFDLRAELAAAEASAFLRVAARRASDRGALWAVPAGRTLRLTTRPAPGAVCICRGRSGWRTSRRCCGSPVRCGSTARSSGRARRRCRAPGSSTSGTCGSR